VSGARLGALRLVLLLAGPLVALAACRAGVSRAAEAPGWVDPSPHLSETVTLDGLRLAYLDWGGVGPPLVLIHGIGGDPHVFDDLAPRLRARFHVLAYARRGHGDSDVPPKGPYDVPAYVSDLRGFLDRLHIGRAHLLAWSTGGGELTRFANLAPDRVGKVVYLDAAYDWSDPTFLSELGKMVMANGAEARDTTSIDAYRAWFEETWLGPQPWTGGLEAFLRDRVRLGADGRIAPRTPDAVCKLVFAGLASARLDYERVAAPALALYAATFFPVDSPNPGRAFLARDFEDRVAAPWRAASIARARRELPTVTIRTVPGTTHASIGVHDVDALATLITTFLTSAPTPE
jgi:pimeloyl-ACP methyl ester carboxylesterase